MTKPFSPKDAKKRASLKRSRAPYTTVLLDKDLHALIAPHTNFGRSDGGDVITIRGAVNALLRYATEHLDYKRIIQQTAK